MTTTSILITLVVAAIIVGLILAYANSKQEKNIPGGVPEAPEDNGTTSPTKPTKI